MDQAQPMAPATIRRLMLAPLSAEALREADCSEAQARGALTALVMVALIRRGGEPMTAPTEAEVREALAHEMIERVSDHSGAVVYDASEPLRELWNHDEFRKSENEAFGELVEAVYAGADEAFAAYLIEALTRVGVEFARRCPDAPRARKLEVVA